MDEHAEHLEHPEHVVHPVQLIVDDDLRRNRLTVFFRLILAIPHLIWIGLWSIAVAVAAVITWIATLVTGTPPAGLHKFLSAYVRYSVHLSAYLYLVANPYPGFTGDPEEYEVDLRLPARAPQRRWTVLVRVLIAIPALLVSSALGGAGGGFRIPARGGTRAYAGALNGGALSGACAFLGWWASLFTGRMPRGLRDASAYGIGYGAQTLAYLLLLTDRYPNADPTAMLDALERPPVHPVRLVGDAHDLRRSRITVFFRLLLAIPHLLWLALWSIVVLLVSILNWFATLATGTPPRAFHRFSAAYTRQSLHVNAFLYLAANQFPGFVGERGRYALDLDLPEEPQRQNRWKTGFRIFLAVPALLVNSALGSALFMSAVLTWFYALATGSAPWGLRNLSAYALRYGSQATAYTLLVTDAYPHASPLEGSASAEE